MLNKRRLFLLVSDFIIINLSYFIALLLRFDMHIPEEYIHSYRGILLGIIAIKIGIMAILKMYQILWRYANFRDLYRLFFSVFISNIVASIYIIYMNIGMPRSIYAIVLILEIIFIGGIRLLPRTKNLITSQQRIPTKYKNTLIVGAGEAGVMVVNELQKHFELGQVPIGFIDDDNTKHGRTINGIPVIGGREDIAYIVKHKKVEEIILAIPSMNRKELQEILSLCNKTDAKIKIMPGYYQCIDNKINLNEIREVEIEDLLGRDQVQLDESKLSHFIFNKTVMVTGGGGSIGSELCRQIVKFQPKQLIILDIYENNAYEIQMELQRHYPELSLEVVIESVRDKERINIIFDRYKPDLVFHAAAHKHVPLMEVSPISAVKNNVFGTKNVIEACHNYGVKKFVLISTDKAVNPTSVMGTTKRICEIMVQAYDKLYETEYVAVRFGNVLGSNGSVIPLFQRQIKEGGPVTVTHENIIRYFMTIPEACQLVLQAGAIAKGGQIFILDMGEPVRIMDLARNLIKLSGFKPDEDIKIKVTGLRPGEKLYEEILLNLENSDKTEYEKIFIEKPEMHDYKELEEKLALLEQVTHNNQKKEVVDVLQKIVPNYKPDLK